MPDRFFPMQGQSTCNRALQALASKVESDRYFYLIAGTHGDEPEGVYVLNQLLMWINRSDIHLPMIIIPKLNPDGIIAGTRVNANGVDLNRNLPASNWEKQSRDDKYSPGAHPASEPENQFLLSLLQQYPPGFILSFHSWKPMLNSNGDCEEILQFLHQRNGYPMVRDEIEGHPTPGSLGSYASEKLQIPVLTFECPTLDQQPDIQKIWLENREALIEMMRSGLVEKLLV
ncbi:succinylglutamate desuccinylase/aspartoacylase family protein [Endozoicomonas sp.]|uniref:M14 family zinc carboxypeptidase n=1 Tax=Endozoicomonas sp. TaxID=1892382 RepID=UPI00383A0B87